MSNATVAPRPDGRQVPHSSIPSDRLRTRPQQPSGEPSEQKDQLRVTIEYVDEQRLIPCIGAIIKDDEDRLLLVLRAHPPGENLWSIPGGRVEPGETDAEAVVREVREETGLVVEVGALAGQVSRPGLGGAVLEIADYLCRPVGGTLQSGDDAAAVRWVTRDELSGLPLTDGLVDALIAWGVVHPDPSW
jgi:8-oxo-dGTP diphosphatase